MSSVTMNRHSTRQLIAQDDNYFLKKYEGHKIEYENTAKVPTNQMFLDLAVIMDTDNDGIISEKDFDEAADMIRIAKTAKENNSAELNYKHMPKAVADVLGQWDADQSGSVDVAELVKAGEAQEAMRSQARLLKRLLAAAVVVILVLMCATFVLSFAAIEMAKDSRPAADGVQKMANGRPVASAVATKNYELKDFWQLDPAMLVQLQHLDIMTQNTSELNHYKITGFKKAPEGDLTIYTSRGSIIEIRQEGPSGEGVVYVDGVDVEAEERRRLFNTLPRSSLSTQGCFVLTPGAF